MKDYALKVTVVFAILLAGVAVWQLRSIVAIFVVSLAIAATVRAPMAFLIRHGVRRGVAMLLVYGMGLGGLLTVLYLLSFPLTNEFAEIAARFAAAYTRLQNGWRVFGRLDALLADRLPTAEQLADVLTGDQMAVIGRQLFDVTQKVAAVAGQLLLAMVLSLYWTADQLRFERLWLSLLPASQRAYARNVWHALEARVGAYIRSEIVQSLLAGILLTPGLWLLGVEYPVLWAAIVSVAWLIPLVGALMTLVPLWLIVWVGTDALTATLVVLYILLVLAFLKYGIERWLYTQPSNSKVLVILVMLALTYAYGLIGLLLAPPLAAVIEVFLAGLLNTEPKPVASILPGDDVAALQMRLDETRLLALHLDEQNTLRLGNMADRLDSLLKQTQNL